MIEALFIIGAYLLGSFPTGVVFAKLRGIDLRAHGSGNIGATNVARTLGKPLGLLTLLIDAGKGLGPVLAAQAAGLGPIFIAAVALASVAGHVFPVWLALRGGKGVATAAGVFFGLAPLPTALAAVIYVVAVTLSRISAVGSLAATFALPLLMWGFDVEPITVALGAVLFVFILWTHRTNVHRLLQGRENKV